MAFLLALVCLPALLIVNSQLNISWIQYAFSSSSNEVTLNNTNKQNRVEYHHGTAKGTQYPNGSPGQNTQESKPSVSKETFENVIIWIWIMGIIIMLCKLLYGLSFLMGFRSGLKEIEGVKVDDLLLQAKDHYKLKRTPELFESSKVDSPLTLGLANPCIVLPVELYTKISEDELRSIIYHELAHIHHKDNLLALFQHFVLAIHWWNPAVKGISRELSITREDICDNHAILQFEDRNTYAECLLHLAKKTSLTSRLTATLGMACSHMPLKQRITNIFSKERNMGTTSKKGISAIIICGTIMMMGGLSVFQSFAQNSTEAELKHSGNKPIHDSIDPSTLKRGGVTRADSNKSRSSIQNADDINAFGLAIKKVLEVECDKGKIKELFAADSQLTPERVLTMLGKRNLSAWSLMPTPTQKELYKMGYDVETSGDNVGAVDPELLFEYMYKHHSLFNHHKLLWCDINANLAEGEFEFNGIFGRGKCFFKAKRKDKGWEIDWLGVPKKGSNKFEDAYLVFYL
ncbi:MAG: M56 family metallopeptidase [Planctomycetes bacterium]|nr:M56 family metallopeptidase [Planctomycetota bacterium]